MVYADYPFCVYCGHEVYSLQVEGGLVVYLCSHCGHETSVKDEGLL